MPTPIARCSFRCVFPWFPNRRGRLPRRTPGLVIGLWSIVAQPALGQGQTARDLVRGLEQSALAAELSRELQPRSPKRWARGWGLARDMGTVALPAAERLFEREDHVTGQLLMLAAVLVAVGEIDHGGLERHIAKLNSPEQRVLALLYFALEPTQRGLPEGFLKLRRSVGRVAIEQVALALALRHIGNAAPIDDRWYRLRSDPGLAAAARLARPRDTELEALGSTVRHHDLVRRGFLLGDHDGSAGQPEESRLVRELMRDSTATVAERLAAALHFVHRRDPAQELASIFEARRGPPAEVLVALVETVEFRQQLVARQWLTAPPSHLVEPLARARIAVAFALAADLGDVAKAMPEWQRRSLAAPVCLGLAWRLFSAQRRTAEALLAALPELPEADWVRLALGEAPRGQPEDLEDRSERRAFELGSTHALPPSAAAAVIERILWRRNWHLGRVRFEAECDLVRDLLLAHSRPARAALGLDGRAKLYRPKGIVGEQFFEVLFEFYRFLRAPGRRVPEAHRLR